MTEDPELPAFEATTLDGLAVSAAPAILVGGFSVSSVLEQDIWRRLIESAGLADTALHVVFGAEPSQLLPLIPPSRLGRYAAARDSREWEALIQPDQPSRSFAIAEGLLVVGPPTEEVWERFEAIARRSAGR